MGAPSYYAKGQWKACCDCKVEKPVGEFYVVQGKLYSYCKECKRAKSRAQWHKNPVENAKRQKEWALNNPEKVRDSSRRARERNPEKSRESGRRWYQANKEVRRVSAKEWATANRAITARLCAEYKARKLKAMPSWASREYIDNMYICSQLCSEATGIKYHVDHIVPLYSELVCGLHVSDNLQVIPGVENMSKGNYRWPDMP